MSRTAAAALLGLASATALAQHPGLDPYIEADLQEVDLLSECAMGESDNPRDEAKMRMERALCLYNGRIAKRKMEAEQVVLAERNARYMRSVQALRSATHALNETFSDIDASVLPGKGPWSAFTAAVDGEFGRRMFRLAWAETGGAARDPSRLGSRRRGGKEKIADRARHERWAREALERPEIAAAVGTSGAAAGERPLGGSAQEREVTLASAGHARRPAGHDADGWWGIAEQAATRAALTSALDPRLRPNAITADAVLARMPADNDGFTGRYDGHEVGGYDLDEEERKVSLALLAYVRATQDVSNRTYCAFHGQAQSPGCVIMWNSETCHPLECDWGVPYPGMTFINGNPDAKTGGGWLRVFKKERMLACMATEADQNAAIERPQWLRPRCNQEVEHARELRAGRGGAKPHWRTDHRGSLGQELRYGRINEESPAWSPLEQALRALEGDGASEEERCTARLIRACDDTEGPPAILPDAWHSCEREQTHEVCTPLGGCAVEPVLPACMRDGMGMATWRPGTAVPAPSGACAAAIEKHPEDAAARALRCADARRQAMRDAARENRGIDRQRIAGIEDSERRRTAAQAFLAAQMAAPGTTTSTTTSTTTKTRGSGPGLPAGASFDDTKACATALAGACPSVSQHNLWEGYDPWNRCPARVRPGSGTPQTQCEARVLETHPGCAKVGRSWQRRAECWPEEEEEESAAAPADTRTSGTG